MIVIVFLISLSLLPKKEVGAGGSYEEVKLSDLLLFPILISEIDDIGCPYIQDERDDYSLGEKEGHDFALVGLSDKVEDILSEIDNLESSEQEGLPSRHGSLWFAIWLVVIEGGYQDSGYPWHQGDGLEVHPEVGVVEPRHAHRELQLLVFC